MNNEPDNFGPDINPTTGLPLIDDTDIDVGGNPYGTDWNTWQPSYDPGYYTPPAPGFESW